MLRILSNIGSVSALSLALLAAEAGCVRTQLPAELEIAMPQPNAEGGKDYVTDPSQRSIVAGADTGPAVLANTRWRIYGTALLTTDDDGTAIQRDTPGWYLGSITVGERGEALRFELGSLNYGGISAQSLFGDAILMDAATHDCAIPGLLYAAESYGANLDEQFGATLYGELLAGPFKAGAAAIAITGSISEDLAHFEGNLRVELKFEPELLGRDVPKSDAYEVRVVAERVAGD